MSWHQARWPDVLAHLTGQHVDQEITKDIVFIVGARRTGSTLLHNLLCSSTDTHPYAGEFQILTKILDAFSWGQQNYDRLVRFYFRDKERLSAFQINAIRSLLGEAIAALAPRRCAVFKNPELSFHIAELAKALPEAKFLAMIRDPRDQAASEKAVMERQRQAQMRTGSPLSAHDLATTFNAYYQPIWRLHESEPHRIMFLRYEDLVREPRDAIGKVCVFLGISAQGIDVSRHWDFGDVDISAMQARPSWSDLYGQPPSAERIGAFAESFTPNEIRDIEDQTALIRRRFGYDVNVDGEMASWSD